MSNVPVIEREIPDYPVEGTPCYKRGHYWVSQHNFEMVDSSQNPPAITIHDVTLRDGEQAPGVTFLEEERVAIAAALNELGVGRIEAGMPVVSDAVRNSMSRMTKLGFTSKVFSFARAVDKDVNLAVECGADGIIIEHCVNPHKCKYGYELTPEKLVERMAGAIDLAKKSGLHTVFMGWDWFRAPVEFTHWLVDSIVSRVELDGLTIVDTVGTTLPEAVEEMFRRFHQWYPKLELEFHGHNDFNLGVACALAAVKGGARVVHSAMNSLGERAGNVSTEEVALTFEVLKRIRTGINLTEIDRVSKLVAEVSKCPIAANKPILGERNYMIESGIATHLSLKQGEREYVPSNGTILPALIGRAGGEQKILGKNSGNASIELILNKHGIDCTADQVEALLAAVKHEAMVTKALVPEETFLYMVQKMKKG